MADRVHASWQADASLQARSPPFVACPRINPRAAHITVVTYFDRYRCVVPTTMACVLVVMRCRHGGWLQPGWEEQQWGLV